MFHKTPSNAIQVAPCGRTDMTKLTVVFRNSANAPKITKLRVASTTKTIIPSFLESSSGSKVKIKHAQTQTQTENKLHFVGKNATDIHKHCLMLR
jgi:hypothetical protein